MDAAPPADWLERVAESLCAHEERRDTLLNFPPRYEVLEEISRGGMGTVYRAWDPQLGRNVALKVLRSEDGAAEAHERFQREARLAASLHHPNIVPIHDTGTWNGQDYIAMQLMEGQTLAHATTDRRSALVCVRDAARALHFAHEQGIVHRDIKPSNLLLDGTGRVYVADFGVARQSVSTAGMTSPGTIVGTPAYMSPEQAQGLPADPRSDVYSLGATLYELLTGKPPYDGEAADVVEAVRSREPETARRIVPDLSKNVEAILTGAMERRPEDRYPTAAALADDIDRYLSGQRPERRPRGLSYKIQREFVRHPWRSAASILFWVSVLVSISAVRYAMRSRPEPERGFVSLPPVEVPPARRPSEREPVPPPPEEDPKPPVDAESRDAALRSAVLVKQFRDHVTAEDFALARRDLQELEKTAPEAARELRIGLQKAEFDHGIRKLDRLSQNTVTAEFGALFDNLKGDAFKDQKDRSERLAPILFQHGMAWFAGRKWSEAVRWLDEAEKSGHGVGSLFEQRGLALLELGLWDRAEKDFVSLRERSAGPTTRYPREFAVLAYRRAHQALAAGDWAEALKQADATLAIDPRHAPAFHDRGLARFQSTGQAREVLQHELKTALDCDPQLTLDPGYRTILIRYAHLQAERYWKSEDALERGAAWREVLIWFDLFLARHAPRDPDLLIERSRMHRRLGDLKQAAVDATTAWEIRPDVETALALGQCRLLEGRQSPENVAVLRQAVELLDQAHRAAPEDARPLYWRGLCRQMLNDEDPEAAVQDLLKARTLQPASLYLSLQLSESLLHGMTKKNDGGPWKEVLSDASLFITGAEQITEDDYAASGYQSDLVPRSKAVRNLLTSAHLNRAGAYYWGREYERCHQEASRAAQLDEKSAPAYYWKGRARFVLREYRPALQEFRMAVKLAPNELIRKGYERWVEATQLREKE